MNVGVAVLAAGAHVAEHGFDVALRAAHILVQAAQRIAGSIVIEFGNGADRHPALRRVTVLTGDIQVPVWAVCARFTLNRPARKRHDEQQQQYREAGKLP